MQLKMCVKIDGARQIGCGSFTIGKVNGNGINNSKGGKTLNMGADLIRFPESSIHKK